jgi:hypothetical protein
LHINGSEPSRRRKMSRPQAIQQRRIQKRRMQKRRIKQRSGQWRM